MPYDTLVWGAEAAANGLTLTASKGPDSYSITGNTIEMKSKDMGTPVLVGLGSLSDTKPQGCALLPSRSNRATYIYGPGAINFAQEGWMDLREFMPKKLFNGETISGLLSNTNTNEGAIVAAHLCHDRYPPLGMCRKSFSDIFIEKATLTSAAAVTYNSGKAKLDAACTSVNWIDTSAKYEILGVVGNIGAATFGGVAHVTGLGGAWAGMAPGLLINPLSAVTFTPAQPFTPALEPIPFSGDAIPSIGMTATSAGAIAFGLVIGKI